MSKKFWDRAFIASTICLILWLSLGIAIYAQEAIDLTALPLGDGHYSSEPQIGYIFACQSNFDTGIGGAGTDGPWIHADGTWDITAKLTVDGAVVWENALFTMELQGSERLFTSNDLPNHPTGVYPVQSSDDAYQYDRNPNSIQEQNLRFALPANPALAASPSCIGGEVGIALTGIPIFSGFDAEGRDAVAHELQDDCGGHPQVNGNYHYHNLSPCIEEFGTGEGHSELVSYAFDGFGIYGYRGEDGTSLTNADLDECHGHTHEIEWDGVAQEMYHYHATAEFPYTAGCFRGTPAVMMLTGEGNCGQPPQGGGQAPQSGGQQPPQPPQGGQGGQQPPPQGGGQAPQGGQQPPPQGSGQAGQPPQGQGGNCAQMPPQGN